MALKTGRYRHYKGGEYQVLGVARHSETEEEMVLYRPLYGAGDLWVRPLGMFCESVELGGKSIPRFAFVGEEGEKSEDAVAASRNLKST